jgi:plastocyanin
MRSRVPRTWRVAILAALAALVVTLAAGPAMAAGKKPVKLEGTVNVHGSKDVSSKSSAKLDVELDNFYFGPTFVKAKAGEKLTLELENEGSAPHTFTSDVLDVDQQLSPGDKMTIEVTVPSDGNAFRFYCRFHQGSGMQGAIYTKAGATATATGTSTGSSGSSGSKGSSGKSGSDSSNSSDSSGYGY